MRPERATQARRWLVRSAIVVVIALLAGAGWVMARDGAPDPDAVLAEAQAFVADTASYRMKITTESRVTTGTPGGAGAETTTRVVTTGAVAGPDRWRMTTELADVMMAETFHDEVLRLGDVVYARTSPLTTDASAAAPEWVELSPEDVSFTLDDLAETLRLVTEDLDPVPGPLLDSFVVDTLLAAYLLDVEQDPMSVVRVVREATSPVFEERLADGGVRLRVTLGPVAAVAEVVGDALDERLAPVDVLLDVDAEGRPRSARFHARLGAASAQLALELTDWGADVEVVAPAEDEIDSTPWVQEEALRALDTTLLIAPTSVPAPLTLTDVTVYEGSGEDWDCTSLDLSYDDPAVFEQEDLEEGLFEGLPYLYLSVYPSSCWLEDDPAPFDRVVGGRAARDVGGVWELDMGGSVVAIDTSLDDAAVDAVVATLGATTADALIAAAPEPPGGAFSW